MKLYYCNFLWLMIYQTELLHILLTILSKVYHLFNIIQKGKINSLLHSDNQRFCPWLLSFWPSLLLRHLAHAGKYWRFRYFCMLYLAFCSVASSHQCLHFIPSCMEKSIKQNLMRKHREIVIDIQFIIIVVFF